MKKLTCLVAGFSLATQIFYAQDSTGIFLKDIIIKENRLETPLAELSKSVEIITKELIQATPLQSVADLLNFIVGVDVRNRGIGGVQGDVSIRGGTFDQTLIIINGIKYSDPQTGHHALNLPLDISNIERIEVLKGPSARVYGQNAFAGAVNIITKVNTESATTVGFQVGDWNTLGARLSVSLPDSMMKQTLSLTYDVSYGYRPNSDFKIGNIFYQNQIGIGDKKLNILGGYTDKSFGASGFYSSGNTSNEREFLKTSLFAADMPLHFGNFHLTPRLSWRRNQDDYYFNYLNDTTRAATHNATLTQVVDAELNSHLNSYFGTTGMSLAFNSSQYFNAGLGNHDRTALTAFAEHRFKFGAFDITPGVLLANYSDFGTKFFPGVDVGARLSNSFKLYANYGRTFRLPTYTDLYFKNAANNPNPDLKPESANVYEIGAKYLTASFNIQAAYFQRDGQDLIDRTRNDATMPWNPTNVNAISLKGIDASMAYRFKSLNGGTIQAGYLYLHDYTFTKTDNLSKYALDFLTDQLSLSFESGIVGNLRQNVRVRYIKRLSQQEACSVVDAKLIWKAERLNIFAQATNIFNTAYAEQNNIPMPTRWLMTGVSYKFSH